MNRHNIIMSLEFLNDYDDLDLDLAMAISNLPGLF